MYTFAAISHTIITLFTISQKEKKIMASFCLVLERVAAGAHRLLIRLVNVFILDFVLVYK